MSDTIKSAALSLYDAGLNVMPVKASDKKPTLPKWTPLQEKRMERDEVASISFPAIAVFPGRLSGGVECFDIDLKNDTSGDLLERLAAEVERELPGLLNRVIIQNTPSGGQHWVYCCPAAGRGETLAKDAATRKVVIETRGEGQYFLVAPSPGYELIQGDFLTVPAITEAEREKLLSVARSFNAVTGGKAKTETHATEAKNGLSGIFSDKRRQHVEELLDYIGWNNIDVTGSYDTWLKLLFALADEFGEAGRIYAHQVSNNYPGYTREETDKQYDKCLNARGKTKTRIEAFFGVLQDAGVTLEKARAWKVREQTRSAGPSLVRVTTHGEASDNGAEQAGPGKDANGGNVGKNKHLRANGIIKEFLSKKNLRYNVITCHVEQPDGDHVTDWHINTWTIEILEKYGEPVSVDALNRYVFSDTVERFNPITEWLDSLPEVDIKNGGLHLPALMASLHIKNPDMAVYIQKWLCSIVAAAYGNVCDLMLVLIGPQNCGKTVFFERLLPLELRRYFAVDKLDQGKDSDILMTQKLIICDDEFYGKSKADAEHLKALLSREKFSIRKPYGRISEDMRRLAVLCGTSNKAGVINDSTGNRRILPVEMMGRDFSAYDQLDRAGLFAELKAYYKLLGEKSFRLTEQERDYLNEVSADHQLVNTEAELILTYFQPITKDEFAALSKYEREQKGYHFMQPAQIASALQALTMLRIDSRKVGAELNQLGFVRSSGRLNGGGQAVKGYYVRKIENPAIDDETNPF